MRFLLTDDNENFLDSFERYLLALSNGDLVCAGKATSGEEAVRMASDLKPDVVFIDFAMPGIGGLLATQLIKRNPAPPKVVILTIHESEEYKKAAHAAGADDFVTKSEVTRKMPALLEALFHSNTEMFHNDKK